MSDNLPMGFPPCFISPAVEGGTTTSGLRTLVEGIVVQVRLTEATLEEVCRFHQSVHSPYLPSEVLGAAPGVGMHHVRTGRREALPITGLIPYVVGDSVAELMLAGFPVVNRHDTPKVCATPPTEREFWRTLEERSSDKGLTLYVVEDSVANPTLAGTSIVDPHDIHRICGVYLTEWENWRSNSLCLRRRL